MESIHDVNELNTRPGSPAEHPLRTGGYFLPTYGLTTVADSLETALEHGSRGVCIYGPPRVGKSWLVHFLPRSPVHLGFHNYVIHWIECDANPKSSQFQFLTDILLQLGHPHADTGQVHVRKQRLVNYLLQSAYTDKNDGPKQVLLVFDEAQNLTISRYDLLKTVVNQLLKEGIDCRILLIGEEELAGHSSMLKQKRKAALIARFFAKTIEFPSISSVEGLKDVYGLLDTEHLYPDHPTQLQENVWPATRYFSPASFKDGFRLASLATQIWQRAIEKCIAERIPSGKLRIPTEYALSIGKALLLIQEGVEREGGRFSGFSDDLLDKVIDQSELMSYVSALPD